MKTKPLGDLWPVSVLTLGGGGLGQIWGETTREEAIATARQAVDDGITLLDMAPSYGRGEAEAVIGAAFEGKLPEHVRVTTKSILGTKSAEEIAERLEMSIKRSLDAMRVEAIDLFFLHSQIIPDDYMFPGELSQSQRNWSVTWSCYKDVVVPAFEDLKARGMIKDWGITATGLPVSVMEALRHDVKPKVAQVITNLLDSPGGIRRYEEPAEPRNILRTAINNDVAVMGIRAVQAGALCEAIDRELEADHPEMLDFNKARPFRELCAEWGEDPAVVAHRYALAMDGVSTVVLGVKNREELKACVDGANQGPLETERVHAIDSLRLNRLIPKIPLDQLRSID